jgi:hypothetical protein
MPLRLADRLSAARRRQFVGRTLEMGLFQSALTDLDLPFQVLHVFGPGGVGKTTLLGQFAYACAQAQTPAVYVDSRGVEPTPDAFINMLRLGMGLSVTDSPLEILASGSRRHVIMIDTYEKLVSLDEWLREVFLPEIPEAVLVVLAGREQPSPAWYSDPGWQALVRTIPLRNLSPQESRTYLIQRQIPPEQHQAILDFTHGHPLALSLVADVFAQRPGFSFQPEATPDVIKTLLAQLVQKVPSPAHRGALEACALVNLTTEALLAEMLTTPDPHELFEWLRGLSFIESGPRGLFPHDLARETLAADLRWRNPDWYTELHRRARTYYHTRLQQTYGQEQQRNLFDLIFLHRDNAAVRPFFEWQESGGMLPETALEADWPALRAMVTRHEGEESARLAAHWFARQPQGILVFRDAEKQPAGFLAMIELHQASPEDLDADPAARVAWDYLQSHAPLRPGEGTTFFRFWMAGDTYQAVSAIQSLIFVTVVRHYLTTPGLAFTFFPCAEPDFWALVLTYADLARIPEADFEVGGQHYGVYGHDWRAVPPAAWLALLAEREIATASQTLRPPRVTESLVVLSQDEFAAAVRDALRDFTHPDFLRGNPLLRSRLVVDQAGTDVGEVEKVTALQTLIKTAAESLQSSPRQAKLFRALYQTYLHPAPTQEKASELLDLPFSTYRRHLKAGIRRLTEILWQREIGGLKK